MLTDSCRGFSSATQDDGRICAEGFLRRGAFHDPPRATPRRHRDVFQDGVAHLKNWSGTAEVPLLVGVGSPSGFTATMPPRRAELPKVTLVLVEPSGDGGGVCGRLPGRQRRQIADFSTLSHGAETLPVKQDEARAATWVTGGLSAAAIASGWGCRYAGRTAFEQAAGATRSCGSADNETKCCSSRGEHLWR
jgi:hypothetical protein